MDNKLRLTLLFWIFLFLAGIPEFPALAQGTTAQAIDTTDKVVRIVRFVGNDQINDNTLENLVRTNTNREFLGINRFTPWYFIWKLTKKFGEPPAYMSHQIVGRDIERIQRYYESIGFFEVSVDTNIVEFEPNKVEVSFLIEEGRQSRIQTLAYAGMPDFSESEKLRAFYNESELLGEQINDSTFRVGRSYSENALTTERNRILNFLKNNGYASVQVDSVSAQIKRDSVDSHLLDILFIINLGRIYHFGDLFIRLAGPDANFEYDEKDTLRGDPYTESGKAIYLEKESEAQTRFSLLTDQILFEPGDIFNNYLYVRTINEFQNLGMMNIRNFGLNEDGSLPDYSRPDIPALFSLQTIPRHSVNFNLFGMKRYGFGSGAGITYTNNNLFGKAENLQLSLNGSFEYVGSETLNDIISDTTAGGAKGQLFQSIETRADYSLPRLTFPFAALDDKPFFADGRTRYSVSVSSSDQLLFDINSDIRLNLRYEVNHNQLRSGQRQLSSFLDLFELDLLDADPSSQFRRSLENEFGEDSFELRRILEDFRPQISSIFRYTFRNYRTDLIQRNHGYYSEYSVAVGGNLPYLVDRFIVTPDTIEGNLPSISEISNNSLSYSRFLKVTADYRRYIPISNNAVFSYRGFLGYAHPYGESRTIPLNQRFFAGGSNDIRGWDIYGLGPGSIPLDEVTINGGEIKLLAQTEIRQTAIQDFLSANWIFAWFSDAGNIWYGPRNSFRNQASQETLEEGRFRFKEFYNQVAVSSGGGLRLDWQYVVVRFDFAFRIHDLQEGWFNNKKLYFSFGIGHSF